MKILRYIACCIVALCVVGCTFESDNKVPTTPNQDHDGGVGDEVPTVPLKKRPIVPTTKLPRPRVVDIYFLAERTMVVEMAEEECVAAVTITEHDTNSVVVYVVDDEVFELDDIPVGTFDIAVEVDGEVETYTVMN